MKRKLLSILLTLCLAFSLLPTAALADGEGTQTNDVAQIGSTGYATLQAAIDAAKSGDTIVLKKSISATEIGEKKQLQFEKKAMNLTLDLNQNTITAEAGEAIAVNAANITLTVKNGTIKNFANGKYSDGVYAYKESNNLTLTFENIVLESRTQGLAVQGLTSNSNVNIVNSKITSTEELGIYYPPKSGTLTITDSEITGVTGIVVKGSNLVVVGDKTVISGTGPNVDPDTYYTGATDGSSSLTETGDALYIESGYNDRDITVAVKGGSFTSAKAQAVRMFIKNGETTTVKREVKVTGGTFSSDVSAYVAEGYVQNENGTVEQLGETNAVAKVGDTYYKTLAEAVAAAKDGDTVTLLKNVVLNSTLTLNKNMTLDLNGCEISNGSTMGTNYLVSIAANANVSIVGDKANSKISDSRSNAQGTITAVVVYGKLTVEGDNLTISRGANGIAVKVEDNPGTLTVNGGTITVDKPTQTSSQAIQNWGNATISGGVFNGDVDSYAYIAANKNYVGNMTIENGTFDGEVFAAQYTNDGVTWPTKSAKVSIVGGNFKGNIAEYYHNGNNGPQPVEKVNKPDNAAESEVTVSDGYFTVDPSAYCVTGKTGVTSDKDGYQYKVGTIEVKDENEIKTDTQKGTTQATLSGEIAADKRPATQAVGKSVTPTALTDTTPITADDKAQALTELVKNKKVKLTDDGKIPAGTTVTVVKETYLDVTVTAYDATSNTVSMDIVPKYNLIAVAKTGTDEKTVTLKSAQDAKVGSTEVKVTLPDAFKGKKVYINHNNGANLYVATANATTGEITFTTNGFSPFTFALSNPNVVAEVNGNAYTSFQDAVNAVANGGTIEIVGGNKNYTATISGSSKTFTVKNTLDSDITVKVNNDSKTVGKNNGTQSFTYTKPSSGGSSGGSSSGKTTYKVTTSAVNNGGVNASPSSAEKGATITITLSPDKGYKLDKLTVTDGSGKTVSTVKKSDTVYTFTMPASAVKVGVSYVKATETPSETKFNDVSANDWFASAVDYVTGKGMMNGTADNTFSPKANTTRGMVVTVLYRLENQPSTSAASFTDVASGAYYANAVAWANANGIVSGYGSGKFGPNDKVTREQLAAILYRYAQYKKYDVSVGEDTNILSYDDAQSISSYAIPAIQWACGAGVVTGKSGSKLDPKGNATRAEVAAMLMRFCENVK